MKALLLITFLFSFIYHFDKSQSYTDSRFETVEVETLEESNNDTETWPSLFLSEVKTFKISLLNTYNYYSIEVNFLERSIKTSNRSQAPPFFI